MQGRVLDSFNINNNEKHLEIVDPTNSSIVSYKPEMWYASAHSNFYKDGNHYFGV
jgi:hypothetical protein